MLITFLNKLRCILGRMYMRYIKSETQKRWDKLFLRYLDFNQSGNVNWWEYLIPITVVLCVEILAELIAQWILK
jgi:hypothetical protein|tara:strand:- start:247 stop:468 length:222 start_codon:yes stop_codon:yes gene_type:complete